MAADKSIISAGEIINNILTNDENVMAHAKKVYPVVSTESLLPYVVWRRSSLEQTAIKNGRGPTSAMIEVLCFSQEYTEGVELAEAVKTALDGRQSSFGGLTMRSCMLVDSEEGWQDDAFVQQMTFEIRIN